MKLLGVHLKDAESECPTGGDRKYHGCDHKRLMKQSIAGRHFATPTLVSPRNEV